MSTPIIPQENNEEAKPTGELKGKSILPDEWGQEATITEPKLTNEKGEEVRSSEEESTDKGDEEQEQEDIPQADLEDLEAAPTLEDPGEYVPADYSFQVTVYSGEEGKEKPRTVTIKTVEEAERLLEEDPNFGSAKNLLDFNRKVTRMESKSENDLEAWKHKKEDYDKQAGSEQERLEQIESTVAEINYLVGQGKLPKIAKEYQTADWTDAEVSKQPGVREQVALLTYMAKENQRRAKAGIKSKVGPLDAYNAWQNDTTEQKNLAAKKKAADDRKVAGARVAGTTPSPVTNVPRGIAVGRGGSLKDITAGWN